MSVSVFVCLFGCLSVCVSVCVSVYTITPKNSSIHLKLEHIVVYAIYKQTVSISLRMSDSVKCRRGYFLSMSGIYQLWDKLGC